MKKILFIIQSYPSQRSANVLCDEKIMQALVESGKYEVSCLVFKYYKQIRYEEQNGIKIYRIKKSRFWERFTKARIQEGKNFSKLIIKQNRINLRIKEMLTIPIYPCYEPIFSHKLAKAAVKLNRMVKYDLVISEHNGFDTLWAGYNVKKKDPNIKFMPILWDPLSGKKLAGYLPQNYAMKKILRIEKQIMEQADKIVAMKSAKKYHEENSKEKTYFSKYCYLDIPKLVRPKKENGRAMFISKEYINVVYAGVLTIPDRNPEYIIKLFNELDCAEKIQMIFMCIGSGKKVLKELQKSFKGKILVENYVSPAELNVIYQNADILLNLGGPNPYMVPSKLFEYISYGKPIVSTYSHDHETSVEYLKKYTLALCVDERRSIEETLQETNEFIKRSVGKTIEYDFIEKVFCENSPDSYVKAIDELLESR